MRFSLPYHFAGAPPSGNDTGRFNPSDDRKPWWRADDLAPLVPWAEKECRGWVLPGYEGLSLERVPWDSVRWQALDGWSLTKKSRFRRVVREQRSRPTAETLYYKWVQIAGPRKALGSVFRSSKVIREFQLARRLLAAGFLTPTPLLVAERRRGPFLRDAWLVTRGLDPGWESVRSIWTRFREDGIDDEANRADRLIEELGRAVRHFHDQGLWFADSRSQHWFTLCASAGLLAGERLDVKTALARWAVIDLDASRLDRIPSPGVRSRLLAMLAASFPSKYWTPEDSRRLLASYCGGDGAPSAMEQNYRTVIERIHSKRPKGPPSASSPPSPSPSSAS